MSLKQMLASYSILFVNLFKSVSFTHHQTSQQIKQLRDSLAEQESKYFRNASYSAKRVEQVEGQLRLCKDELDLIKNNERDLLSQIDDYRQIIQMLKNQD